MLWLLVGTLGGALIAASPRTDASPHGTGGALPRPSRAEIDVLLQSPERRVRSVDRHIEKMLQVGANRSHTFAGLLAALDRTDVIVYIETAHDLPSKVDGRLLLLPVINDQRYLRIQIRANLPREDIVPLIAHELRHALEVAEEPGVRDEAGMADLYRRIGDAGAAPHAYDTPAARSTGRQVRTELIG